METCSPVGHRFVGLKYDAKAPTRNECNRTRSLHVAKKRATLTMELAQEIFLIRTMQDDDEGIFAPLRVERSVAMSKVYGISPKAVRDVWNRSVQSRYSRFKKIMKILHPQSRIGIYLCTIVAGKHGDMQPTISRMC
jgi:hypothetical protein